MSPVYLHPRSYLSRSMNREESLEQGTTIHGTNIEKERVHNMFSKC